MQNLNFGELLTYDFLHNDWLLSELLLNVQEDKPAWFWAKQKQSDPESTPLIDEVNFKRKKFVPDLVVESMLDVN